MFEFSVTPEFLVVIVAGLLALVFDYFPVAAKWYDGLEAATKRQFMLALVIGVALVIFAGQCFNLFVTNLVCSVKGGFDTLYIVFLAISVNQGVHFLTKPTSAFRKRMFFGSKAAAKK